MIFQIIEPIVWVALAFIIADLIFGTAKALYLQTMDSTKLRHGFWHKLAFVGGIVLAYMLQIAILHGFDMDVPTVAAVSVFLIYTEAVSIFENLCEINPKLLESPLGHFFKNSEHVQQAEKLDKENR